jgi:hypothetical protein
VSPILPVTDPVDATSVDLVMSSIKAAIAEAKRTAGITDEHATEALGKEFARFITSDGSDWRGALAFYLLASCDGSAPMAHSVIAEIDRIARNEQAAS